MLKSTRVPNLQADPDQQSAHQPWRALGQGLHRAHREVRRVDEKVQLQRGAEGPPGRTSGKGLPSPRPLHFDVLPQTKSRSLMYNFYGLYDLPRI